MATASVLPSTFSWKKPRSETSSNRSQEFKINCFFNLSSKFPYPSLVSGRKEGYLELLRCCSPRECSDKIVGVCIASCLLQLSVWNLVSPGLTTDSVLPSTFSWKKTDRKPVQTDHKNLKQIAFFNSTSKFPFHPRERKKRGEHKEFDLSWKPVQLNFFNSIQCCDFMTSWKCDHLF